MPSARSTSEPNSLGSTDSAAAATDIAAEAALVLAAVSRMQAAAHGDRLTIERLREALGEMASIIAQAKAALFAAISDEHKPDMAALLDQLEYHVDAMIETAGGNATGAPRPELAPQPAAERAAAATAETDQVPTVSSVVSGLGNGEPAATDAPPPPDAAPDQGPSVAMLKAMVEALSASAWPTTRQTPTPEAAEGRQQPTDLAPPAAEAEPLPAGPAPPSSGIVMQELLASYERMEARPIPPPEEGTAVIFTPRAVPPAPAEPAAAEPPAPVTVTEAAPAAVETPQATIPAPPSAETAAAPLADTYFDPADFLFGPEPEPEPAAFLLEPAPSPLQTASMLLPHAEFVSAPATPSPPPMAEPPPADGGKAREQTATAADPLAPLKAMTEAERIAIFS